MTLRSRIHRIGKVSRRLQLDFQEARAELLLRGAVLDQAGRNREQSRRIVSAWADSLSARTEPGQSVDVGQYLLASRSLDGALSEMARRQHAVDEADEALSLSQIKLVGVRARMDRVDERAADLKQDMCVESERFMTGETEDLERTRRRGQWR
jgi:hypothetical protein